MNAPARFSGQREILEDKFFPFSDICVTLLQLSEFIEPFAEGGWECSHSIRSAILLRYWCPDFCSTFFWSIEKIFSIGQKKNRQKIWKMKNFEKLENVQWKISNLKNRFLRFEIFHWTFSSFSKFFIFQIFWRFFFWPIENIFSIDQKKVEQKSGHQYRSKIALRIEWEHSQPPSANGSINSESCSKVTQISEKGKNLSSRISLWPLNLAGAFI